MNCFENKHYLKSNGGDMTAAIEEKLNTTGACLLGSGVYYVSGIKMPKGTALMGMGNSTKVILMPEIESGAAIYLGGFCTVKDLAILGSEENIELPEEVGDRHGIYFLSDADGKNWDDPHHPRNSIIESCYISSFTGGGISGKDTGYSIHCAMTVSNCHIINCGAGINLIHFSEYHQFTNVLCCENLYGCINNGGNNDFVNCGFNANKIGYLIDNSRGQSNNNSHGSVVGCTFNHSDSNKGIGIILQGAANGYVFSGCQMFYSKIVVENSKNILFTGFNFGAKMEISIKDSGLVMFSGNMFLGEPSISAENVESLKIINCFNKDGSEIKA